MSIAANIKKLRKQNHMTQKQLAIKSGLAVITIQQYEAGKFNPKPDAVMKLCVGLNCKITDIIDDETKKYYRIFDNEKVTEKIDYDHSYPFASSEKELNIYLDQQQKQDKEASQETTQFIDSDKNIHKFDASIRISSEALEREKEVNKIYEKIQSSKKLTENDVKILKEYNQRQEIAGKRLKELMHEQLKHLKKLQAAYEQLNDIGQEKVIEHAEMIAKIPEYRKDEPSQE